MKNRMIFTICLLSLAITGCSFAPIDSMVNGSSASVSAYSDKQYKATDPSTVKLFNAKPNKSRKYIEIGEVTVKTDDFLGASRSEESIRNDMKEKAASIGGHAVINIKRSMTDSTGTVIRYKGR